MQFIVFFSIATTILALGYGYVGWRLIRPPRLGSPWKRVAWAALALLSVLPTLSIATRIGGVEASWGDLLSWIGYLSLGFLSLVLLLVVFRDLGWLGISAGRRLITRIRSLYSPNPEPADPPDPERRRFLITSMNLGIVGIAAALTGYGVFEARRRPGVVEVSVSVDGLPDDLDGFRIVQITDIHVGPTVKRDWVETVVDVVNGLSPDLIACTGDLADGAVSWLRDDVAPLVDLSARHGAYFVTGNHEYYSGVHAWLKEVERLGFKVLVNEHDVVQRGRGRAVIAGVTDSMGGRFHPGHVSDPMKAISGAPEANVKLLLAHRPQSVFDAVRAGFDVQLSGHTHGGQIFPWSLLVPLMEPYVSGLHTHQGMWIYVSRGTGYWGPPVRVGQPSEVTVITLTASDTEAV